MGNKIEEKNQKIEKKKKKKEGKNYVLIKDFNTLMYDHFLP